MSKDKFSLGLDFGTESVRAVCVNIATGEIVAESAERYPSGVIDEKLPQNGLPLPPGWALQDPRDWIYGLEKTVTAVLAEGRIDPRFIIGIGIDFTSCTLLPVNEEGVPLCTLPQYQDRLHAWPKLWKHHAAQPQAERITALAQEHLAKWLLRYGGKISSEWFIPKALQILEEDQELYRQMARLIEGADWIVWQLTGVLSRSTCASGYKAGWHKREGFPPEQFLFKAHPELADLFSEKNVGAVLPPGAKAGLLSDAWAGRLGLRPGIPLASPIIDAHGALLGGGVAESSVMFMIMGTSTCHLLLDPVERNVEGICGVVEDGILPGYFGYEAGQGGSGDIFAWFLDHGVPPGYHDEASQRGITLHDLLTEKASRLVPGQSGLVALDWWNGNRSILVDSDLSGLILGYQLSTRPEEIYRALIEATAFGTLMILDAFTKAGIAIHSISAGGSQTKNSLLMQIYADITGREITVVDASQVSALGAAMLGAMAAGEEGGGYASLELAVRSMAPAPGRRYLPEAGAQHVYRQVYQTYSWLYGCFGRENAGLMKSLLRLRQGALRGDFPGDRSI